MDRGLPLSDQLFRSGPPRPSAVLRPGAGLAPGEERYTAQGGGVIAVPIQAGDRLRIVDLEGMQLCELVAADASGNVDPSMIGAHADGRARGLKQALAEDSESAHRTRGARTARHRSGPRPRRHFVRGRVQAWSERRVHRGARRVVDRGGARRRHGRWRARHGDADPHLHPAQPCGAAGRNTPARATIALARVDATYAELGTKVEVGKLDGHQKRLPARIVRLPHYDPEKTRVRS